MKPILCQLPLLFSMALLSTFRAQAEPTTYDVRELGAKGDGQTLDTDAIQKTFDAVKKTGGTIHFPAGNYISGPLELRGDKITVQLDENATLFATTHQAAFLKVAGGDFNPFLSIKDSTDLILTGKGIIDGNGPVWWEKAEEARRKVSGFTLPRPNLIVPMRCNHLRITGITIRNSPKFHLVPTDCNDVWIEVVKILSPEHAANTDAIDPTNCRNVTITNCFIDVGGIRNVTVRKRTFEDTDNGIRIKSDRTRGGTVETFVCEDITMKSVHSAISITCYYPKIPAVDTAQAVTTTTPEYRNIILRNLTGTCSGSAGCIVGLPESAIENVLLENVNISPEKAGLEIRNAKGVECKNVKVAASTDPPIIVTNAEVHGLEK